MSTTTAAPHGRRADPGRSRRRRTSRATPLKYAVLIGFAIIVLTPVYVLLVTSFKTLDEIDPAHAWSLPQTFTVDAWRQAWTQLSPSMQNSFKLAIPATILSCVLGSLNRFVLSKWRFRAPTSSSPSSSSGCSSRTRR